MTPSSRGFPESEFRTRLAGAQRAMADSDLAALLLTTAAEIQYFTGFLTRFWESPTRPWFLVLPADGDPIAVIPSIGAHLMGQCWISDIRTWSSPSYQDDGVSLLGAAITETVPGDGRVGVPSGPETHLRMPLESWEQVQASVGGRTFVGDGGLVRGLRSVKSELEIEKIRTACGIAGRAFERVPEIARAGDGLSTVFRRFQAVCLEEGADWVSYLAGGAGPGGYGDVISPAEDRPLADGDVLMLDTGLVWDGYFCDFDRNYAIGEPSSEAESAYQLLIDASEAAFEVARPGTTAAELFAAMDAILRRGSSDPSAGRLGHGLGLQLTEWPSLMPEDHTALVPGMVLTLEPAIVVSPGHSLVHEENIVVTEDGAEYLSKPAKRRLPRLEDFA